MIALLALLIAAEPLSDVGRVADALADGEQAQARRSRRVLARAADRLEMLGARPLGDDAAARWRAARTDPPLRGRALGPAYRDGVLAPGASVATTQLFFAGQRAEVAVVPQGDARLAMRVGPNDRAICAREVAPPRGGCSWTPIFTERVEIRVTNPGPRPARYWLVSN